ncbi:MAG TPA: TonB-dependent receptor plug domain-containing protein [Bacteroidales bacterium]|nr:TonB-dependent receptor plug domain-containing protein [Bacteroidales bacterium]
MNTLQFHRIIPTFGLLICSVFATAQNQKDSIPNDTINPTAKYIYTGYSGIGLQEIPLSVSVIESATIKNIPAQNITGSLQGSIPGVQVIGCGEPGNLPEISIRGYGRFSGNSPLILVDGVPVDDISAINPYDIDKVVVLKDGQALAIYGARGMNGVIELTTKKGSRGFHMTYDFITGMQLPGKGPDVLNTQEYADLQWLVYKNDNYEEINPLYGPSTQESPTLPSWAANTDWYKEMTHKASVNVHQVTFNGGNEHARFLAGFGYHNQEGLLKYTYSKRYSVRFNSEWTAWDNRVTIGENIAFSLARRNDMENLGYNAFLDGPFRSQPIIPVFINEPVTGSSHQFTEGEFGGTGMAPRLGNAPNVVADLIRNKDNYTNSNSLIGSAFFKIHLLKGLDFTSSYGGSFTNDYRVHYSCATYERAENLSQSTATEGAGYIRNKISTNLLTYVATFGNHEINAFAGIEKIRTGDFRELNVARSGYFSDAVSFRTVSNGSNLVNASSWTGTTLPMKSEFFGIHYGFKNRYLLDFSFRNDKGSSYFKPESSRIYTGLAATWRVGKEEFLNKSKWLSGFDIRGSYGSAGNIYSGFEYMTIVDVGIEGKLWHTINFMVDWYSKKSPNLLMSFENPVDVGDPVFIYMNSGSIRNRGLDMQIGFDKKWDGFGFNSQLIFTKYSNKIQKVLSSTKFFDSESSRIGSIVRNHTGQPVSTYFGYKVEGLFRDDAEISQAPIQDGAAPGFFRYADLKPDNQITMDDRTFLGSPHPDFTMGLNVGAEYKNFDLGAFVYWCQGTEIFNFTKWWTDFWPSFQGQKSERLLNESWTEQNPDASVPKASATSNFSTNTQINSYYVEDGSYIRMKSLQLGYTLRPKVFEKIELSSVRLYLNALNLFTLKSYSGLDPETGNSSGIDNGSYPNVRQFLFGLQVKF